METCIGWLLDVYIEDDNAILWIKTNEGKVLKLIDNYSLSFYILPKTDHDRVQLLQLFSQQTDTVKQLSCEQKYTNLFDSKNGSIKNLITVGIDGIRAYKHILKKLEKDPRVEQLFNTDLLDVQQYLFTKLKIESTSKVRVVYDGLKACRITKIDDTTVLAPPPFSLIYVEIKTSLYGVPDNSPILMIRVRDQYNSEYLYFQESDEELLIRNFASYIMDKDPDIIVSTEIAPFQNLFKRIKKLGLGGIRLGRDDVCCVVDDDEPFMSIKNQRYWWTRGRVCISSSRHGSSISISNSYDEFGLISLVEKCRFSFLPLDLANKYGVSSLIDSRNCYELIQRDFVIPPKKNAANHEQIRTVEDIVKNDKGCMIISPQIGLHQNVIVLDYENEYANLIVKHNLSYETFTSSLAREPGAESQITDKALLPTVVEKILKRRTYFKDLLKTMPKDRY